MIKIEMTLDIMGIIILTGIFFAGMSDRNKAKKSTKYFVWFIGTGILFLLSNVVTNLYDHSTALDNNIKLFGVTLYPFFGYLMCFFITKYLSAYLDIDEKKRKKISIFNHLFTIVNSLVLFALAPTGLLYYYDKFGNYTRGEHFYITYILVFVGMIIDECILISVSKKPRIIASFSTYFVSPLISGIIQLFILPRTIAYNDLAVIISCVLLFFTVYLDQRRDVLNKEIEISENKIKLVTSQIRPNFVYNTLTNIASLCDIDVKKAQELTVEFSDYLRHNLDFSKMDTLNSFEEELNHARLYLKIEKESLGDKLNVVYDLEATKFSLPPLTLQPIVENAVKHGLSKDGGTITILTRYENGYFTVEVSDDGAGFDKNELNDNGGRMTELQAIKIRLENKLNAEVHIKSEIGVGTRAICRFKGIEEERK